MYFLPSPWSCISPLVRFGVVIVTFFVIFTYWFWTGWRGGKCEASDDEDGQQSERIGTPVHVLSTRAVCCKYCSAGSASDVYLYCVNRKLSHRMANLCNDKLIMLISGPVPVLYNRGTGKMCTFEQVCAIMFLGNALWTIL